MSQSEYAAMAEAALPQTQCQDCGYENCHAYAVAVHSGESPALCRPGGEPVLTALLALRQPPHPAFRLPENAGAQYLAFIRDDCIGCVACIRACPVDAIVGAAKFFHAVIEDECTGCGLCVPVCPVDCIDMYPVNDAFLPRAPAAQTEHHAATACSARKKAADYAKNRYLDKQARQSVKPRKIAPKPDTALPEGIQDILAAAQAKAQALSASMRTNDRTLRDEQIRRQLQHSTQRAANQARIKAAQTNHD